MTVSHYLPVLLILFAGVVLSIKTRKLSVPGAIIGGFSGLLVFMSSGYCGIIMLGAFFFLGTLATAWKRGDKQKFKANEDRSLQRNAGQVLANGGVAAIAGLLAVIFPSEAQLFRLMLAAALASATADTLSSELGMVYGRRFFNILTLKKEAKGLDGVISIEGTLIGITGAVLIAVIYGLGYGWTKDILIIVTAGTIGNLADSFLGALFERKKYLNNDHVNFLNTLIAALTGWLCLSVFG